VIIDQFIFGVLLTETVAINRGIGRGVSRGFRKHPLDF